jgi:hypothetical protein
MTLNARQERIIRAALQSYVSTCALCKAAGVGRDGVGETWEETAAWAQDLDTLIANSERIRIT